jgi:hypothetical protein
MKTLYTHDGGEIICIEHAGYDLKYLVGQKPKARKHWTPHGTWELATAEDFNYFKQMTGIDMECEECQE